MTKYKQQQQQQQKKKRKLGEKQRQDLEGKKL